MDDRRRSAGGKHCHAGDGRSLTAPAPSGGRRRLTATNPEPGFTCRVGACRRSLMASVEELSEIAESTAFIFTGAILRKAATAAHTEHTAVVVVVHDVIKLPPGMRGFAGREVTVHLQHPLSEGHYVFFADPMSVGSTVTLRERVHLDAKERSHAEAAVEHSYAARLAPRLEAAVLVALGTTGPVTPVLPPDKRRGGVPWALSRLDIERVLKGPRGRRHVTLIGPSPASKHLPRAPALRAGIHAVFLLQRPPEEAIRHVPEGERQSAGFIAETTDIQPPDRAEHIARLLGAAGKG